MTAPLAITMGDACGIGPEIIARCFAEPGGRLSAVVIGDPQRMARAVRLCGADLSVETVDGVERVEPRDGVIPVLPCGSGVDDLPFGAVHARAGQAAYDAIIAAIDLAMNGTVSAIVTAPINKEALSATGISHPGHTEILAERAGVDSVAMMLANDEMRTVLVTIHVALREVFDLITVERELKTIELAASACHALGIAAPRVAVAGLNPHAGEGGLFGREEIEIITPAIEQARASGIDVTGPWPGDTVFARAREGEFDIVVAQYHDQGLIPVKYLGLADGVNVTIGLPFVRTSPDHGTAFDIAGKGVADHRSMLTAIRYAERLAEARTG